MILLNFRMDSLIFLFLCVIRTNSFGLKFSTYIIKSAPRNRICRPQMVSTPIYSPPTTSDIMNKFFEDSSEFNIGVSNEINQIHQSGALVLKRLKLPSIKDEAWRHNNLKGLFGFPYSVPTSITLNKAKTIVKSLIDSSCEKSFFVLLDGRYSQDLSQMESVPPGVTVSSFLMQSEKQQVETLRHLHHSRIPDQGEEPRSSHGSDVLAAVNMARCSDVLSVIVSQDVKCTVPIQIICLSSTSTENRLPAASYPSVVVSVAEGASLKLKQTFATLDEGSTATVLDTDDEAAANNANIAIGLTQISVARHGSLEHTYVQETSAVSRHLGVVSADVQGEGRYDFTAVQLGARYSRINVHVNLTESGANCSVVGLSVSPPRHSQDLHSSIQHLAPGTNSEQEHRNIVGDRGESIFKGRIRMPSIAQKSASSQMCRSLLLGSSARLQAMPVLEISADDVTCSHGAAVADLDENCMFYLASRGISRKVARQMLLGSFAVELLQNAIMDKASVGRVVSALEGMTPSSDSTDITEGGSQGFFSI